MAAAQWSMATWEDDLPLTWSMSPAPRMWWEPLAPQKLSVPLMWKSREPLALQKLLVPLTWKSLEPLA